MTSITKDLQYYKFCSYGFFKNLRFFDAFLVLFFFEKGIGYLEIGLLYGTREIAIMFMEIPSGLIADALGRRRTLIASFLFYISSFLLFYFSTSLILLFSAMILFAIGDAFRTGVHKAMIFQYLKANGWTSQRVNYYGHTRSWSQVGSAFSALIAGVIVFFTGAIQQVFLWSVVPYLVNVVLIASYPKWLDGEIKSQQLIKIRLKFLSVWKAFVASMKERSTLTALISTSLFSGYYSAIKDYVQPMIKAMALAIPFAVYLNNDQKTAFLIGLVYFIIYLLTAAASRFSGRMTALFAHPYKPMNLTMIVGFGVGITGFSFYYLAIYSIPVVAFLVVMMIENVRKPLGIALIAELAEDEAMASVLSVTSQAKSLIAAILAGVTGLLAELWGLGTALVAISLGLLILYPFYRLNSTSPEQ
ncbi:MAG: MFS transporter [Bacteroidetes bacterium CG18_big_fil_WC_8_21_14_2_50_41_14]|nr:MAG: MFS transporter [Bacteroidetes bacterium CG18_big_fil_WC_8_21_14_2_50_41_14]